MHGQDPPKFSIMISLQDREKRNLEGEGAFFVISSQKGPGEGPGSGLDALSGAGCTTTEGGGVLPQRRHLQSHCRADRPYLAVLGALADKPPPGLAASFSKRGPSPAGPGKQHGGKAAASNPGVPKPSFLEELRIPRNSARLFICI